MRYLSRKIITLALANPELFLLTAIVCEILFVAFIICTNRRIDRQIIYKWELEVVKFLFDLFINSFIKELICWIIGGGMW